MRPEEIDAVHIRVTEVMRREYESLTPAREKMEKTVAAAKKEYALAERKYKEDLKKASLKPAKEPQCARCQFMEFIFQGKTQKERNNIAGLIHDAVEKFGCDAFVRRADLP